MANVRRGGTTTRGRGQAVAGRGKGRVGKGLNEAAKALLGMCIDADEELPQVLPQGRQAPHALIYISFKAPRHAIFPHSC